MFMNVPIRSDSFRSVSKFFLFVCRSDHSPRLSFQSSLRAASSKTTSQLYRALHRMVPGSVKRVLWQITKNTKYHIVTSKHITTCCVRIQSNAASCYIWTAFVISTTYVMTKITCIPYRRWFTDRTTHCIALQYRALLSIPVQCTPLTVHYMKDQKSAYLECFTHASLPDVALYTFQTHSNDT